MGGKCTEFELVTGDSLFHYYELQNQGLFFSGLSPQSLVYRLRLRVGTGVLLGGKGGDAELLDGGRLLARVVEIPALPHLHPVA